MSRPTALEKTGISMSVVVQVFDPSTWEVEVGSRPAWQPGLHSITYYFLHLQSFLLSFFKTNNSSTK